MKEVRTMIVAIASQKGGTGKTTTTTQLALALVRGGHRVLVVDLDQQGCASALLGGRPGPGVAELLFEGRPLSEVVQKTPHGVDLVAGSAALAGFDLWAGDRGGREAILRSALRAAPSPYDLVLLDCPPGLGLVLVNALVAADACVSPTTSAQLSRDGLARLDDSVLAALALNPALRHLGYLLCQVDRSTRAAAQVERARSELRKVVGRTLWPVEIGRSLSLSEGLGAPRSRAVRDYAVAADVLLRRLQKEVRRGRRG